MTASTTIEWQAWQAESPPSDFVDRVMRAALAPSNRSAQRTSRLVASRRAMAVLAAAAVAAASFAVLATVGGNNRVKAPARQGPEADAPSSGGAGTSSRGPDPAPRFDHAPGTVVDRQLRDEVRAKLVKHDPPTGLTIPTTPRGPENNQANSLSGQYIRARMQEDFFPLARACYKNALARNPTLRGRIVIDFMIVGDSKVGGIVDEAKISENSDITDLEFTTCIRESMLSMVFEPPPNNGWTSVTYPIVFWPDDEVSRDQ